MEMLDAVTAFDGAVSGLSKLTSLIRNVRGDVKSSEINEAVDAVRDDLNSAREKVTLLITENLSMQQKIATLTEENMKLNQAAERHKAFEVESGNYELRSVGRHTTLYAPKTEFTDGNAPRYVCVSCFQEEVISIVQFVQRAPYRADELACPKCSARYIVPRHGEDGRPSVETTRDYDPRD